MIRHSNLAVLTAAAALLTLTACSHGPQGIRITSGSNKPEPQTIHDLGDADMKSAIVGKTFQYTRPDGNGFITYNADGTFNFTDDAKGAGKGTWSASGNQFCESYNGAPMTCGEFKSTGDAYFAAKSRLVEMKT